MPLTVIPQGDRYETFFAVGFEVFVEPRLSPFTVEVTYRDLKGEKHIESFKIDISQFDGRRIIHGPEEELAKAAKDIAAEMQKWTSRNLPVETVSHAERRRKEGEFIEQMRREEEFGNG